jgi:UDP-galactopyranose mutase
MRIAIVGAGLAGATAYQILRSQHQCEVYEASGRVGGMLYDEKGIQWFGPRAFHTNSEQAWSFVTQFAKFKPFDLRVEVQTDPIYSRELPFRQHDPAWRIYSEKAWGMQWQDLPDFVTKRVPNLCTDNRTGYHHGHLKGQPVGGYYKMIQSMLRGATVHMNASPTPNDLPNYDWIVWTGNINEILPADAKPLPWIGREWTYTRHAVIDSDCHIINYATRRVPQIRSYKTSINPYHDAGQGIVSEYFSNKHICYPHPEHKERATTVAEQIQASSRIVLCGRLGGYSYLDMDSCILDVMNALQRI